MSIAVQCPNCAGRFSAPDNAMGKVAPCPKCGNQLTIEPPAEFETAPVIRVSQADIELATRRQKPRRKIALIGVSVGVLLAVSVVGYLVFKSEPYSEAAVADVGIPQTTASNGNPVAGLGFSLDEFKENMPLGEHWRLVSETKQESGRVVYQLRSRDFRVVSVSASGLPENIRAISFTFAAVEEQTDSENIARILLMASVLAKYSEWTEEEIGEWWGRLIQRGASGEEEFYVQKNGHELWVVPMGVQGGTFFMTGVAAKPESKAPTLKEWLATHPMAPPKSGKSHFHSTDSAGKVANANFSFKNFRHKGRGGLIGELTNESGRSYQAANFKISLYDATGALIDTGPVIIMDFKPKESRSFDTYIRDLPDYFSYKIDFESGF